MQPGAQKKLTILFWLLVLLDILFIISDQRLAYCIVKVLLMPALMLLLLCSSKAGRGGKIILAGLIFSWIGDGLLLFESRNSMFFIFGLASFLTTHIFYIIYFFSIGSPGVSLLKKQPVTIYAAVISTMLISSLYAYCKINKAAGNAYIVGAVAFVLSDSLLAVDKFYHPIPYAGVFIMLTYCAAQYYIVRGFMRSG